MRSGKLKDRLNKWPRKLKQFIVELIIYKILLISQKRSLLTKRLKLTRFVKLYVLFIAILIETKLIVVWITKAAAKKHRTQTKTNWCNQSKRLVAKI